MIPWGYDVAYPSDYDDMLNLAKKAAAKFRRYKYTVGNSADLLYPAAGNVLNLLRKAKRGRNLNC